MTARLFADARVVELRAALQEIIDASYGDDVSDLGAIRGAAVEALRHDDELRERMATEGVAPLPPGGRLE